MVSLSSGYFLAIRNLSRRLRQDAISRGLRTSTANLVAQNFAMPALSPTMIEGNIAKWNVKEGDSYSAGDVLLEIETDKASMDVEAQEDGKLVKIIQGNGTKGVKVGTRIGILAEVGDDLSTLDLPLEDTVKVDSLKTESLDSDQSRSGADKSPINSESNKNASSSPSFSSGEKPKYPLLPSVQHLMRLHNIDHRAIDQIKPSGFKNRLLKGDVLAYLGKIPKSYPSQLSNKITNLSHLDLSDIRIVASTPAAQITKAEEHPILASKATVNLEQSVSFDNVHKIQEKMKSVFGVSLSEDTFISRATNVSNNSLPQSRLSKVTSSDLFNDILGLKRSSVPKSTTSYPFFTVQVATAPPPPSSFLRQGCYPNIDIIDFLSGKKPIKSQRKNNNMEDSTRKGKSKIFKLEVAKEDEERARLFLSQMKITLENKPQSLLS